jgi:hypothetical protein
LIVTASAAWLPEWTNISLNRSSQRSSFRPCAQSLIHARLSRHVEGDTRIGGRYQGK